MKMIGEINGTQNFFTTYDVTYEGDRVVFKNENIVVPMSIEDLFNFMLKVKLVGGINHEGVITYRTNKQLIAVEDDIGSLKLITREELNLLENKIKPKDISLGSLVLLNEEREAVVFLGRFFFVERYHYGKFEYAYYAFKRRGRVYFTVNPFITDVVEEGSMSKLEAFEIMKEAVESNMISNVAFPSSIRAIQHPTSRDVVDGRNFYCFISQTKFKGV